MHIIQKSKIEYRCTVATHDHLVASSLDLLERIMNERTSTNIDDDQRKGNFLNDAAKRARFSIMLQHYSQKSLAT